MNLIFSRITPDKERWDIIQQSVDRSCFFTPQWDSYLRSVGIKSIMVEVIRDNVVIGHFIGSTRRLGIRIISAPSMGTGTYAQGLCMIHPISHQERISIYRQLADWFFYTRQADYIQICDWQLRVDSQEWIENWHHPLLDAAGIHYQPRHTFHLDLSPSEEELWNNLQYKSCKYSINKARKNGLTVNSVTDNNQIMAFVHQHRLHVLDVLQRHRSRGLPCQREKYMYALCSSLTPEHALMLQVIDTTSHASQSILASSIFSLNKGVCTYFTGGSYQQYMHMCPNEIMLWEAIRTLRENGATDIIFGGIGHYKKKFGAVYAFVPVMVFSRYKKLLDIRKRIKSIYSIFSSFISRRII